MDRVRSSGNGGYGQSLIEVLIAVFIGILLFVAAASIIAPVLRSNTEVARMQTASSLAKQLMEHVVVFAGSDWHNVDGSPGSPLAISDSTSGVYNYYHLTTTTSPFELKSEEENLEVGTTTYKRYFYVENAYRRSSQDNNGDIDTSSNPLVNGSVLDPSTKKVTVLYSWAGSEPRSFTRYITRTRNNVLVQTDWSGGDGLSLITTSTIGNKFFSHNNIEFASSVGSLVLLGVGVPPPPPAFVLTVASNADPDFPASIAVSPQDISIPPLNDGSAPPSFTRTYANGIEVTLTAQDEGEDTNFWFRRWLKNGIEASTSTTVVITMTANTTMTATYWK